MGKFNKNGSLSLQGKIICDRYECISSEKGRNNIYHGSSMGLLMTLKELKKHFGVNEPVVSWLVILGVDMVKNEKENKFEDKTFEIFRTGNVPADFSFESYDKKYKM